ncbi:hypothetical protein MIND_00457200 [Mycena indigotica]|uniref:Peptidase S26 domain-containing protein n=1 Tax=Mycena indigotica TaxID=2126181 RepID=A0A8H6SXU8_9AGAR|nr:uncharacterized protein MIND_00457200 [Mycena indigotica]KAF7306656.1 hypothetical protein MIND_00457200 [Mycena indigotica]
MSRFFKSLGLKALKVINAAAALHLLSHFGTFATMSGPSMLPTLAADGEVGLEDRWSVRRNPDTVKRGDIITVRSPLDPRRVLCKRVTGLAGDIVSLDPSGEGILIPPGHMWIEGDNPANSRDSRNFGPVPMGLIEGRLVARIWPPSRFTVFRNPKESTA